MGRLKVIIQPAVLCLTNYYAQRFGISRDLGKPYIEDHKAMQPIAVEPFNLYHFGMSKLVFHGKDRAPQLQVARIDYAGRTLLLPVTFYASAKNPSLYCMMPEVPDRPALYNADAIAANPGATVTLTDELGVPLVNDNDSDFIYCSWYGGMDVIDKLDRDLLEGHPIRWLCFDNGNDPAEKYENALRINAIFQKHGLQIAFQVFDGVTWARNAFNMETGTYESSRVLSFDELKVEAAKYGVDVGESSAVASVDLRVHSMDELMALKPKDFVLYPLLKEGFYCLIYGGSGVAKTWLALHLAVALSQGMAPFAKWEFRGQSPLNVLYVAGEMKPEEYGSRLRTLLADQKTNARFCLVREDLDLTTPEDQERVIKAVKNQKSQVVVLDNLSTLATNGHTEGQFEKVLSLIRELQATGIIVILVHHENREGNFKGSGRISLVADISLHLFHAGDGKKIELLVQPDKARSVSNAEFPSFHTEFDPGNPTAIWPTRDLKLEERRRLDIDDPLGEVELNIGKKRKNNQLAWEYLDEDGRGKAIIEGMLNGCHDDVIAADLAVRESVIADFKQQYGLSP
jgi:KaiC/GvpD/RAD55 family RecA-like ATPase